MNVSVTSIKTGAKMTRMIRKQTPNKKGEIWISAALYLVISVVVITIVLSAGLPMLDNMRDRSAFEDSKKSLLVLDQHITEVANEGPGSQRVVPLEIKKGTLSLDANGVSWSMKTKADIIDPRSKLKTGNLIISSNVDVDASATNSTCTLENSKVRVTFLKTGNSSNFTAVDTSLLIQEFRDITSNVVADGNFTFLISNRPNSNIGTGYIVCNRVGTDLDYASVTLFMYNTTSTPSFDYEIEFILDSEGDFIKTKVNAILVH